MSIIQTLRDKAAWIMTAAIAFALLVFVIEEGLRNKSIFGGSQTDLGKVNGTSIKRIDFEEKLKKLENRYTQMGYPMDENTRNQQRDRLWNELVENAVLDKEFDKLGLEVTDKELGDFLYGANPPQDFAQRFTDPATGRFDANQAYQTVQQLRKQKTSADYASFFGEYLPALIKFRKREKLEAMMTNSAYAPKWLIEKTSAENSQIAAISYVTVPYYTIPDSTIKITDAEILDYVGKNRALFKQEKEAGIDYVYFNAAPSKEDSAAIYQQLSNAKDSFARTGNIEQSLQNENSQIPYYDSYITRKEIKISNIDTILKSGVGNVFGPYLDGGSYVLSRVVNVRQIPENVKVRHILIATQQQTQTGKFTQIRDETEAKRLVDSIALAIKTGSNFDSLCSKFSDDGTKDKGGIYDSVVPGKMVPTFNDFIFTNLIGSKGVVKTEFGFHYIEILSQKGSAAGYKIAYLSKPVYTSDETDNKAKGLAAQFAAESRTKKQFEENAKKQRIDIFNSAEIKPLDPTIRGVGIEGNARELVRWIFTDAKMGEVSEQSFVINNGKFSVYMVPVLTHLYEEGTMGVERARTNTEFKIRQQKKALMIAEKIGNGNTLDLISKAVNQPIQKADSISFGNPQIGKTGYEPKVAGAAFNKNNQTKISGLIAGELGAFILKTESLGAVPNPGMDVKSQQSTQQQQLRMVSQRGIVENLKKAASIKDDRYKYF
ncbi:MAG: peptidylprolyl isomerase [Chitinophagaceae bacterium]